MCVDFAKMVLDCEMIRMIKTVIRGVVVNDDTLALDTIKEVGAGGQFLGCTHTLERCRTEHAEPELFNRLSWDDWMSAGRKETVEKAYEKAIEIVNTHKPLPLQEDVASRLKTIIADVEIEYGVRE